MSVETALYPSQLNTAWPLASDMVSEGDDHIRLLKTVFKTTFPNVAGAISATDVQINFLAGVTSSVQSQIDSKGAKAGQAWTGTHDFSGATAVSVPTLAQATSTTGAASTAFVQNEWATRLPNYTGPITASTTQLNYMVGVTGPVQAQINTKGAIAGQAWSGTHVFPNTTTVGPLTPTIQGYLATVTSDVQAQINGKGAIAGQTWGSGTHDFRAGTLLAPTRVTGDATENVATTAFVAATALSSALPGQAGNAGKFVTTDGTSASWSYPALTPVVITANTTAAPGNFYIIATAGITLTIPATFVAKDPVGFGMSRGITSANVNWTTNKVKGRTPGTMQLLSQNDTAVCVFANATDGFMEAA